jgi:hypothetical protein
MTDAGVFVVGGVVVATGAPVGVPAGGAIPASVVAIAVAGAGTHSAAPHVSDAWQQAATPPKRQVGWASAQALAHSPIDPDEMHAAPFGQQPLPSAQAVCDAAQMGDSAAATSRPTRPPTMGRPAAAGVGVISAWRPAWSWGRAVGKRRRRRARKAWAWWSGGVGRMVVGKQLCRA